MPVPFLDSLDAIGLLSQAVIRELADPRTEPHRAAAGTDARLVLHQRDHRIPCCGVELGAVGVVHPEHTPRELDDRALHTKTNPKERDLPSPRVANRLDFPFNAAHAETTRHE